MADLDKAVQTQIANIEKKTGKSLAQLSAALKASGKAKHGELRDWAKEAFGLGHGDANTLVHIALQSDGASAAKASGASIAALLDEIYAGKKAHQRPIHDALMAYIETLGPFEIAPKKGYVSLRRKKQFAMFGPKTNERFELGINSKVDIAAPNIIAQAPGGMCQYIAPMTGVGDIDKRMKDALKKAFDAAG
jgi:hypothetical protein